MKKILLFVLCVMSLCTIGSCTSPTNVDAYRNKYVDTPVDILSFLQFSSSSVDIGTFYPPNPPSRNIGVMNTSNTDTIKVYSLDFKEKNTGFSLTFDVKIVFPIILAPHASIDSNLITINFWRPTAEPGDYYNTLAVNSSGACTAVVHIKVPKN